MEEGEFAIYHPAPRLVRMLTKAEKEPAKKPASVARAEPMDIPHLVRMLTKEGVFVSECQTQTGEIVYADNSRMDKPYTPHECILERWPEPNPNREVKTGG